MNIQGTYFVVGDQVNHPHTGDGTITAVDRGRDRYYVQFDHSGRWLPSNALELINPPVFTDDAIDDPTPIHPNED